MADLQSITSAEKPAHDPQAANGQPQQVNQQPPAYGQPEHAYGQSPPAYGQPQPQAGGSPGMPGAMPQLHSQQVQWMARPETIPGCPPGLEYLTQIDQLLVHQQKDLMEMMTNYIAANRYAIKNTLGQQIFYANEESDNFQRQCCAGQRGFVMHITDNADQEVIRVTRDFKCLMCARCYCFACCDCQAMEVSIEAPPGTPVGSVKQQMSCTQPRFQIRDTSDNVIFSVNGPGLVCQGPMCSSDQDFLVMSGETEQEVGKISKQWSGYVQELLTNADKFGMTFPMDLDVKMKACMIGALFLIDFMYFERRVDNRRRMRERRHRR